MQRQIVLTSLLLLSLAACKGNDEAPPATAPEASTPTAESGAPAAPPAEGGSPMAPLSSSGQAIPQAGAPGEQGAVSGGGIDFDLPSGWMSEPPQSNMRLAQASFEGPGGPGQLAVF